MLVPSMTLEEIRREVEKDYPILLRKTSYVLIKIAKRLSIAQKEKGFVQFFEFCSKYRNHWIYRTIITKKQSFVSSLLLYHNGRGHVAIAVTQHRDIIYYTAHFFKRYNERRKLNLKTNDEIYHTFLNENIFFKFEKLQEVEPGIFKIFCVIDSGIVLGMYNSHLHIVKANTFISHDMLRKDQLALKRKLINELEKYKHLSDCFH